MVKRSLLFFVILTLSMVSYISTLNAQESKGREKVTLGGSKKRKKVKLDYKSVNFAHKKHQLTVEKLGKDCKFCHHKKREGRDPRACRRCHAGRRVKSTGGEERESYVMGKVRKGKLISMKDAFHAVCRGCHEKLREQDIDLNALGDEGAPLKCEGCHNPKE